MSVLSKMRNNVSFVIEPVLSYSVKKCQSSQCIKNVLIHGLFKKYPGWNCSGYSLGGMCLQPVLTCSYMS